MTYLKSVFSGLFLFLTALALAVTLCCVFLDLGLATILKACGVLLLFTAIAIASAYVDGNMSQARIKLLYLPRIKAINNFLASLKKGQKPVVKFRAL